MMAREDKVVLFLIISGIICVCSWDTFECDLRTGEGCTNNSENGVFTVMYKGYRNTSRDRNKECKHFLRLKVKLTYNIGGSYLDGTHLTSLGCHVDLENRYFSRGPITISEDPDATEATTDSPYFECEDGSYYELSSRKNNNGFKQTSNKDLWKSLNFVIENGTFQLGGQHETYLSSPEVFTPEHPDKELYIGVNMRYAPMKTERNGKVIYSDKIEGGACKIRCETWDKNAS